jgi:acetyl esterase
VIVASRLIEAGELAVSRAIAGLPRPLRRALAGRPIEIDGQVLDRESQALVRSANLLGLDRDDLTPAQERSRARHGARFARGRPIKVGEVRSERVAGAAGELDARLYLPADAITPGPLLVYFHGGGYVIGDLNTHDQACRLLCREIHTRVLSVAYRLAPEHPFPAAVEDGLAAFRHAVENAHALGADPGEISVGGDSAGGGLAASLALILRDEGGPSPASQLLIYPWSDLSQKRRSVSLFREGFVLTEKMLDRWDGYYARDERRTDPRISPLLADDLSGLPRAHFAVAGFDPLRDEGLEYAERLRDAGNEVTVTFAPDLVHSFINAVGVADRAREAFTDFCAEVRATRAAAAAPQA